MSVRLRGWASHVTEITDGPAEKPDTRVPFGLVCIVCKRRGTPDPVSQSLESSKTLKVL